MPEKIRWSPRIRPALVERLYQSDALGMPDTELCQAVGMRLYFRCQTILMVLQSQVACPRCGTVFVVRRADLDEATPCPGGACGWQITQRDYHQSWRKQRIWGGKARSAFQAYYQDYPKARTYQERMLLIDRLIHSFHWDLKTQLPNRSAANNLIEGNHAQVVQFLDKLSGIDPDVQSSWREITQKMMQRRRGG